MNEHEKLLAKKSKLKAELAAVQPGVGGYSQNDEKYIDSLRSWISEIDDQLTRIVNGTPLANVNTGGSASAGRGVCDAAFGGKVFVNIIRCRKGQPQIDLPQNSTGLSTLVPSEGGDFPLIQQIATGLTLPTYGKSVTMPYVDHLAARSGYGSYELILNDEAGTAEVYWVAEGAMGTLTKPKVRILRLELSKLMGFCCTSEELLQDAVGLWKWIESQYSDKMARAIDNAVFNGEGNGTPLGILKGAGLVTVTKRAGQVSDSITWENCVDMYARLWARSLPNRVWYVTPEGFPELSTMARGIGVGGVPVWMPANSGAGKPYSTLLDIPVVMCEMLPKLGDAGDLLLCDMSDYAWIDKNGIEGDTSIHVHYLTDENLFRFRYRCIGAPKTNAAHVSPKNANWKMSPYVALGAR